MPSITNVVVLLFENRSYDNVLGWLYNSANAVPYNQAPPGQSTLNGLTGSESNVNPYTGTAQTVANAAPNTIGGSGQSYPATAIPIIDPNETFGNMAQQYLGVAPDTATPWDGYEDASAPMSGFLDNYQSAKNMSANNIADAITYLTPAQLPVSAYLANKFGVCDQWFASVPTQTFTNRLFALCAAPQVVNGSDGPYSVVDDEDHPFHLLALVPESSVASAASILSQLDLIQPAASGPQWKLYFHDYSIAVMTLQDAAAAANSSPTQNNVSTFDSSDWGSGTPVQLAGPAVSTFVDDVQNGTLPPFAFIEPRYNLDMVDVPSPNDLPPNSNHPGAGNYGVGKTVEPSDPPIDATGGELLLMQVYNLLRHSSYWDSTLLIITYDEAGGVYDHAAPPLAAPVSVPAVQSPEEGDTAAANFGFNVFGGRVPAIIVSPYIAPGSTIRVADATFDHSSIVKTVWDVFNLGQSPSTIESLTARDAAAPSLTAALDFSITNSPAEFSGTIVPSPSAVILVSDRLFPSSTVLLASAGPKITLTAAGSSITTWDDNGQNWVTVTPISGGGFAPDVYAWTIGIDTDALGDFGDAFLTGQVTITPSGKTPAVTVGVSLYLS
jgi:phospholipase C